MHESGWDVLVIGGGPGGSAAAIHAAAQGLRVALLERLPFPRERPGESLHPGVEPILETLGVMEAVKQADFLRPAGLHRIENGKGDFHPFGGDEKERWYGFQAWRAEFDQLLLHEAERRGVSIYQPVNVTNLVRSGDQVIGLTTDNSTFKAPYIIDATGRSQWLSRKLSLSFDFQSPQLIAWYGYLFATPIEGLSATPIFEISGTEWAWSALVKPDLLQWTRLSLADSDIATRANPPGRVAHLPMARQPRGVDVTWRIASRVSGPGFFLVGDAAAILDPAASNGVLKALMTGMKAADLIAMIHSGKCDDHIATANYDQWVRQWHGSDGSRLLNIYRRLQPCPDWVSQLTSHQL